MVPVAPTRGVEERINMFEQWRGPAACDDKTATIDESALRLAAIFLWSAR